MKTPTIFLLSVISIILASIQYSVASDSLHSLVACLSKSSKRTSDIIYTPTNSSYFPILASSAQNPHFVSASFPKPLAIVTPLRESEIQEVVVCSKQYGIDVKVRSGGHDYEGLSYVSPVPFLVVDLRNLRSVSIDAEEKTAWVETGATLGELYYAIAKESKTLGFVGGLCPTVGVGGHFTGGGWGMMSRKFGLAADNIIDARMVDANGRVLDRESMGEDLFWAIKGAGSAGFGVVTAWKIKLADVPEKVTVSVVMRTSEQNATQLVHRWQYVASKMDENLVNGIMVNSAKSPVSGDRTIFTAFITMFLGGADELVPIMENDFPELGLTKQDCIEVTWIESILFFYFMDYTLPHESLLDRKLQPKPYFKGKSDIVQQPIPETGIQGILDFLLEEDENMGQYQFMPLGGRFDEIPESATPFPYRAGNLYILNKLINWDEEGDKDSIKHINWVRDLHNYMEPYVSKNNFRGAYYNFRDLDLGVNKGRDTSYDEASIWGIQYFKNNFKKLAQIKALTDPENFFWSEQSVPPLLSRDQEL